MKRPKALLSGWKTCAVSFCFLALWLAAPSALSQPLSKLPYVPTPQVVVDEMLKMAGVTARDFVIDLGSGDGRMIITAARNYKAGGLGVDIDPRLVELANRQAAAAGVDGRVNFIQQDMFKTDISKATVLTLYVLPDFMEKLRPKLLLELKPGSRIVAHDYHMSGWYPDRRITLTVPEKVEANGTDKAYLYLWIVPSAVAGDWRLALAAPGGEAEPLLLSFAQEFQMIRGSGRRKGESLKIDNPVLDGSDIAFHVAVGSIYYRFTGKVLGDKMEGTASLPGGKSLQWRAARMAPEKKN